MAFVKKACFLLLFVLAFLVWSEILVALVWKFLGR